MLGRTLGSIVRMSEAPATEPELETPAARIIGELLEQGEAVDEGGFTLDAAAAVAKLDAFAYVDRSVYLLPMVEGLIGLGARAIVIETEGEDLRVGGLGLQLDAERWFAELYSCAIGTPTEGSGRAIARLAIGLDMLLGSGTVKSVRMSYSRPSHAIIGEYRHREPARSIVVGSRDRAAGKLALQAVKRERPINRLAG